MKLLVMDTSNWPLGVAVIDQGVVLGEINSYISKNHSLRLMPAIEQLLQELQIKPGELQGIGVAQGPGSYTGVRIGVTTAKTLAWTLQIPLAGVSSLQVIAQNRPDESGLIIPLVDARRGQVYRGIYRWDEERELALPQQADRLQLITDLIEEYRGSEEPLLFIGEGVSHHREVLEQGLGDHIRFAREIEHRPRAAQLAQLVWKEWHTRQETDIHSFVPEYLQLAEAEANWLARQGGSC
ncbi:tRNA (adenosine(37)-N6)-threonylcarbamoyltransferase complex dimerization subunit type 1 TsaB [Caldalkalibacillus mannanilyticus]|uniref:tRNA (adenosine(37)-N6)-threonylcarbamoyltransferase complex dimerization subunit type 1 TsaB n=1 Tax=Caldalkalibacillus mannanilyticus TaxID=1418 RepID=UPI00046AEDC8|nr:tRNA (adenosine(37)-N6)-threonylcarbamoyltransferase complex dimerization subunit type 1 TsaB [Caldalkalibacillus mannanilyticus]